MRRTEIPWWKVSFWKLTLGIALLFVGVQSAWAQQNQNPITCKGTVYFKAPANWTGAFIGGKNVQMVRKMTLNADGFYEYNLGDLGITDNTYPYFSIGNQAAVNATFEGVTNTLFAVTPANTNDNSWYINNATLHCPGEDEVVYVTENPNSPGRTFTGKYPPGAKYFFVMIPPEMEAWMSSVPMLSMDGGLTGKPMTAVADMCGWYSYVFVGQTISDNVVLFRDDDPIDPLTGTREDMIGVNGNCEQTGTAQPIPLGMIFDMGVDSLFFVPDEEQKTNDDGYYYSAADVGNIVGTCSYSLAAVIYDTDPSLHPAFSCWVELNDQGETNWDLDCQEGVNNPAAGIVVSKEQARAALQTCIGVTPGMIESTLGPGKKPVLKSGAGTNCFLNSTLFNYMFNNTPNVNEMTCYDMPFKRSKDGRWEFDSDYDGKVGNTVGGFAPREYEGMTSAQVDALVIAAGSTPLPAARLKHAAQGPAALYSWLRAKDRTEDMPIFDLMCNGPGWDGGIDCSTHFAGGNDLNGVTYKGTKIADGKVWCWGEYCNAEVPVDWPKYVAGSETLGGAVPRWQSGDVRKGVATGTLGRNQHFCFESHATFTYKPGLRFNFRGDDDIWVFIGGKLAVDLGGTHMAAPAYVNLDSITDAQNKAFEVGKKYDLDIFFCDRRTTMSNVRITTNMYIQQKAAIEVAGHRNPVNPAETVYDSICYMKTSDGSCAAALSGSGKDEVLCNEAILNAGLDMSYTLVRGKKYGENVVLGFDKVTVPNIYRRGIDLTNFTQPKVDKSNTDLPGGYYTLFVTIEGKYQKVISFQTTGEVSVVYTDGKAISINEEGDPVDRGEYKLLTSEMGGKMVPVYISNVATNPETGELQIFPDDAVGVGYTLQVTDSLGQATKFVKLYYKNAEGAFVKMVSGEQRTIGASGVDTVYAMVDMEDLQNPSTPFKISVSGSPNGMTVNFYLPQITFIEKIPEVGEMAKSVKGQTPKADGSYEEYWKMSTYEMYLAIVKPNPDGTFSPCIEECNGFVIHKGAATSPKIEFVPDTSVFVNGYATITIRSQLEYRWDTDPRIHNPATIVAEYNDYVQAVYSPIYFRDPPVPLPVLSDVFDVRGSTPPMEYKMPSPYFSMNQEYLDGIGDSVAIYYDRPIHKDSLPTKICLMWDSTVAVEHNPVEEGFSNIPADVSIFCNELVLINANNIDCSHPVEIDSVPGYCTNLITIGGLKLSESVKTAGLGKVHSYAEFKDKGKLVKQGFTGTLTDRMAPVPLRAEVRTVMKGDELSELDSLVLVLSEPVKLVTTSNKKSALDFYLNSAIELNEDSRYVSALGGSANVVTASNDPMISVTEKGEGRVKCLYSRGNVSPHVGDYVRLGGDLTTIFWTDDVDLTLLGGDTMRVASDAAYYWNSPTTYNETTRLPSMWIPVTGDAEIDVNENKFASTANADSVWMATQQTVTVNGYRTNMTKAEILAQEGGRPGHLVKADMYALFNGLTDEERSELMANNMQNVYFSYEVEYFTNLGNFVTRKSQKIYCDDNVNLEKYGQAYFGGAGTTCIDAGMDRNFYIGWNMRSDNGRMVGTGAYIVKLKSFVKMGSAGKKAKQESTSIWGVRRSPKPDKQYMKNITAK